MCSLANPARAQRRPGRCQVQQVDTGESPIYLPRRAGAHPGKLLLYSTGNLGGGLSTRKTWQEALSDEQTFLVNNSHAILLDSGFCHD